MREERTDSGEERGYRRRQGTREERTDRGRGERPALQAEKRSRRVAVRMK